jgi:hypothetical protein
MKIFLIISIIICLLYILFFHHKIYDLTNAKKSAENKLAEIFLRKLIENDFLNIHYDEYHQLKGTCSRCGQTEIFIHEHQCES